MARLIAIWLLLICAGSGLAQESWTARTFDSGTYLMAGASHSGSGVSFECTAPSPQGRPAIETGSYEMHVSKPFEAIISFQDSLFDWAPPYTQSNVILALDGAGFRLPPFDLDELSGTAVYVPMADTLMLAFLNAQNVTLYSGTGKTYQLPTAGLADALRTAFTYCIDRWIVVGAQMPPALAGFRQGAASPALPGGALAMRAKAEANIQRSCGGPAEIGSLAIASADIDGDGIDDVLVDFGQLTCLQGPPRPFCGASRCSATIFLSARARPYEMIVLGASLIPLSNGLHGVAVGGGLHECRAAGQEGTGCQIIWYWNGTEMVQLP